jgi:acid phosphatase family membrane protein YuiD
MDIKDEFIAGDASRFKWRLGRTVASSFAGFLVGIIITVIAFLSFFDIVLKS